MHDACSHYLLISLSNKEQRRLAALAMKWKVPLETVLLLRSVRRARRMCRVLASEVWIERCSLLLLLAGLGCTATGKLCFCLCSSANQCALWAFCI